MLGSHYVCGYRSAQTNCPSSANALATGKTLWASENGSDDFNAGAPALARAVAAKLTLIASDPFEQGDLRRLLNLGHCIGHPLEAASGYQMLHGEAIAAGIAVAATIAHQRAHQRAPAAGADRARILNLLTAYQLPTSIAPALREQVWHRAEIVRRVRNGPLHLVVPYRPGECGVLDDIDHAEFESALADLDALTGTRP